MNALLNGLQALGFLSIWTWLVGSLGLAGAAVLIVVALFGAPTLAGMIGGRAARLLGEFLNTRIGLVIVVALCCWFAGSLVASWHAADECELRITANKLAAAAAAKLRDEQIAVELKQRYGPEIERLIAEAAEHANEVAEYERTIAALNTAGCKLRPDALRLRNQPQH